MKTAETHRATVETCVFCPKLCRWACPVADAEARETVTPWGLMTLVDDVARGRARLDRSTAEALAHCTGCRRCEHVCKHQNPMPTALMAARAEAVSMGVAPGGWAAWLDEAPPPSGSLDALPAGGAARLVAGYADEARVAASLRLLRAAGLAPGRPVVGGETVRTTGHRAIGAGRPDLYAAAAKRLRAALDGVELVVCLDAEDAEALRFEWFEAGRWAGPAPRIMHLVEAVSGLAPSAAVTGDVVYLDGCRLGRGLGLVDAPRALLRAVVGGVIHEAVTAGEDGGCCGAGAGLPAVAPADAAAVGGAMTDDVPAALPVVIAGHCAAHLRAAVAPRPVWSWAEIVARGLPDEPGAEEKR